MPDVRSSVVGVLVWCDVNAPADVAGPTTS